MSIIAKHLLWVSVVGKNMRMMRGLTLLELVIALAIFGILLAMAVPMFQSLTGSSAAHEAADRLLQDVQWAQGQAVQRNMSFTLNLNGTDCGNSLWAVKNKSGTVVRCMSQTDFSATYPQVVTTLGNLSANTALTINSLGMVSPIAGSLLVRFSTAAASKTWTLTLLPTGRCEIS